MRLLLTNDDGIAAPGILALARRLLADGHELTLAAPFHETSGSGTSVGSQLDGRLTAYELRQVPDLPGVRAVAVDGPPALAVLAVCHGLIDVDPDLVISGINPGNNVGRLSLHSGTLGAAMAASGYGLRAVAVSCPGAPPERYEDTAHFTALAVEALATRPHDGHVFNINYPACGFAELRGVRAASMATPSGGDVALERGDSAFSLRVARDRSTVAEDSDLALLHEGFVSVTYAGQQLATNAATTAISDVLDRLVAAAQGVRP